MIKVNLLRDQAVRVRKTTVKSSAFGMGLVFLALLLILFGGLGTWWYSIHREVNDLTETRDRLRAENTRMQALKKEVDRYEKLKLLRQSRIDIIEKLKDNQTGPVQLLNHLILSIPHDSSIWLTLLDQKGDRIQIVGYALRPEAVPDFLSNLTATGFFKSVDLELLESDKEATKFSLLCLSTRKQPTE
jgi:type IV pilus assembly protein PilN